MAVFCSDICCVLQKAEMLLWCTFL
uniref:Uncharacterized protein n=1 Tax=Rhizophora mucronata TaxID=61149 RepID=A0A2P2JZ19_RHIMU